MLWARASFFVPPVQPPPYQLQLLAMMAPMAMPAPKVISG